MTATTKTVTVRITHGSSIPGACWCQPVGWEPANEREGASYIDGSWYDDDGDDAAPEVAGLVWFGNPEEYEGDEDQELVIEVSIDDLRIASCGDCKVIGEVKL